MKTKILALATAATFALAASAFAQSTSDQKRPGTSADKPNTAVQGSQPTTAPHNNTGAMNNNGKATTTDPRDSQTTGSSASGNPPSTAPRKKDAEQK